MKLFEEMGKWVLVILDSEDSCFERQELVGC